jgi:hypothetical protein
MNTVRRDNAIHKSPFHGENVMTSSEQTVPQLALPVEPPNDGSWPNAYESHHGHPLTGFSRTARLALLQLPLGERTIVAGLIELIVKFLKEGKTIVALDLDPTQGRIEPVILSWRTLLDELTLAEQSVGTNPAQSST